MALILPGGGVADISGSIGGTVFFRNRFGLCARARTHPVNPQSGRQMDARAVMAYLVEYFRESPMTDAIRLAWATYAAGLSMVNRLGQAITITGQNAFIMGNAVKLHMGFPVVSTGPTAIGLPAQDPTASAALSEASGITTTFDDTMDWCDEDNAALSIEIGQPQSPSRNFFNGPWRVFDGIDGDSITPPSSPTGPTAVATWTLIEGQAVWVRFRILREDGRVTKAFGSQRVIVAA